MTEKKVNNKVEKDFKMNAMQLMNGVYNLFSYLDNNLLEQIWQHANEVLEKDIPFKVITNLVLTRWWLVGTTACDLDNYWDQWKVIMKGIVNLPNKRTGRDKDKTNAVKDIAAANKNLMTFDEIRGDIKIIAALHTHFIFPHFQFLQEGDPLTGNVAGYQGRLLSERYFLMHRDLTVCEDEGWKNQDAFKGLVEFSNSMESDEVQQNIKVKVMHSINIMIEYLHKHFDPWCNTHLPYALFSSVETAQIVAQFLLDRTPDEQHTTIPPSNHLFQSKLQKACKINLGEYRQFLQSRCRMTRTEIESHQDIREYKEAIKLIANKVDMWAENSGDLPTCLHEYRKRYLLKMSANPTISQAIERAVKLSNHVNLDSGRKRG